MSDILFKTGDYVFSYRVAGVVVRDGLVLLQKPTNDTGFAFPGGHSAFGETNAETLRREFREELGADVSVGDLMWVGELFFPWGDRPCQQICLYYQVSLRGGAEIPLRGVFEGAERLEGRDFKMEFHWVPLENINNIEIYPTNAAELLGKPAGEVQHFIYKERD